VDNAWAWTDGQTAVYSVGTAPTLHRRRRHGGGSAAAGRWTRIGPDSPIRQKIGRQQVDIITIIIITIILPSVL